MNRIEITAYIAKQTKTRRIDGFVVHCTATKPSVNANVAQIDIWHKNRGFKKQPKSGHTCGYHFVVLKDGSIEGGRYLDEIGAHVAGHNSHTIGICYVGGLDEKGEPKDTRTDEQKEALTWLLKELRKFYPKATIKGHRDYSPDLNHNGIVEQKEWLKACPCFNAITEYKDI